MPGKCGKIESSLGLLICSVSRQESAVYFFKIWFSAMRLTYFIYSAGAIY